MALASSSFLSMREYNSFYKKKSVLNSYKFDVWLNFDRYVRNPKNALYLATKPLVFINRIQPYHILSVDLPLNTFNRESTNIGSMQYSYPVLSKEQALDIKITFEEDHRGTIAGFIQEMQESVIRKGLHVPPVQSRLGDIHINLDNQQDGTVSGFIAKDVFFLGATGGNHTYDGNDTVKYDITFGTDVLQYQDTPDLFNVSGKRMTLNPSALFG